MMLKALTTTFYGDFIWQLEWFIVNRTEIAICQCKTNLPLVTNELGGKSIRLQIMSNDLLYYQQINRNIAAIINGHENSLYHEQESEDISELSIPILQKKLKKIK